MRKERERADFRLSRYNMSIPGSGSHALIEEARWLPFPEQPRSSWSVLSSGAERWKRQRRNQRMLPVLCHYTLLIGDGISLAVSVSFALLLLPTLTAGSLYTESWAFRFLCLALVIVSWYVGATMTQAYTPTTVTNATRSWLSVTLALLLVLVLWAGCSYPFFQEHQHLFTIFAGFFSLFAFPLFGVWRVLLAMWIDASYRSLQTVVITATSAVDPFVEDLQHAQHCSAHILGYITEIPGEQQGKSTFPVLGGRDVLQKLLQHEAIDMIILALDYKTHPRLFQDALEATLRDVLVLPLASAYEQAQRLS